MDPEGALGQGTAKIVVGSQGNSWLWSPDSGWDLTHPSAPDAEPCQSSLVLPCEISNVTIDPRKTALVIIDMQNISMSTVLNPHVAALFRAQDALLRHGIPAARKTDIQVIWLNWGLTEEDLTTMVPGAMRVFGWEANITAVDYGLSNRLITSNGRIQCGERRRSTAMGDNLGCVIQADGTKIDGGRKLMRDTWNTALHGPLQAAYEEGQKIVRQDVLINKNRNSGLWNAESECNIFLKKAGIRTLLFAGMNTDQCVMATLQDAHSQGYDTILLEDGCATDSPEYAQRSAEYNCCRNWGFLSSCQALAEAALATRIDE